MDEKISMKQISELCNISFGTMCYWFKNFNIPIRSMKESSLLGKKGKVPWNKGIKTFDEKSYAKKYYINHKEEKRKYDKEYAKNNKERISKYKRIWKKNNLEHFRELTREWARNRRKTDVKYNLRMRMSLLIRISLKSGKKNKHWESLVNYTLNDLVKRLKKTMPKGYTWQDYLNGDLHIDHIIPVSVFNFNKIEDYDFQLCWDLNNLQLLPAKENIIKSNKLTRPFQPALSFG